MLFFLTLRCEIFLHIFTHSIYVWRNFNITHEQQILKKPRQTYINLKKPLNNYSLLGYGVPFTLHTKTKPKSIYGRLFFFFLSSSNCTYFLKAPTQMSNHKLRSLISPNQRSVCVQVWMLPNLYNSYPFWMRMKALYKCIFINFELAFSPKQKDRLMIVGRANHLDLKKVNKRAERRQTQMCSFF